MDSGYRTMHVYFIQCHDSIGLIKIGKAANPMGRLAGLQTGSPHKLSLIGSVMFRDDQQAIAAERKIHRVFLHCRRRGEWFSQTTELRQFILAVTQNLFPFAEALELARSTTKKKHKRYLKHASIMNNRNSSRVLV